MCAPAATDMTKSGKKSAMAVQCQPILHRRQRESYARRPARPLTVTTTMPAARLGPKLPANISSVASQGDPALTAGDSRQQAHDQPNVSAK